MARNGVTSFYSGTSTFAGGLIASLTTQTTSVSQSAYQSGTDDRCRSEGGPSFGAAFTQSSITTSYTSSVNQGTETLAALGAVSGGGNSFTFIQSNSDSLAETGFVPQNDTASFSEPWRARNLRQRRNGQRRLGLVRLGPAGLRQFHDFRDRRLRHHGRCDRLSTHRRQCGRGHVQRRRHRYPRGQRLDPGGLRHLQRNQYGIDVFEHGRRGTSISPYELNAYGWDEYQKVDTGSSTLTTDGHVYSTDTYTYNETSTESDVDNQSVSSGVNIGLATDLYVDNDIGTIVVTDSATTSFDSYVLYDAHAVSGSEGSISIGSGLSDNYSDTGVDTNVMLADGTNSTTGGNTTTFSDVDTSGDNYVLDVVDSGEFSDGIAQVVGVTTTVQGAAGSNSLSSWYSYETIASTLAVDTSNGTTPGRDVLVGSDCHERVH